MTVPNAAVRNSYVGNGVTTVYPFTFKVFQTSEVLVYVAGVLTGVGFVTTIDPSGVGGNVTFTLAPANGLPVLLISSTVRNQSTDWTANDPDPAESKERAFDRAMKIDQEQDEAISRSLRAPVIDNLDMVVPNVASRASRILGFDAGGLPVAVAPGATSGDISLSTIIASGSITARSLATRFSEIINVKDYGAIGDGSTNDTAAISAALAAVPSTGGLVLFPSGTYIHSTRLSPKSGTCILGYGATIKAAAGISNGYNQMGLEILGVNHVAIYGLKYDGNRVNRTVGGSAFGIYCANSTDLTFADVDVVNAADDGIEFAYSNNADAATRCSRIMCHRVKVDNSYRNGWTFDGCVSVTLVDCNGDNSVGTAPQTGFDVEADNGVIFNDNIWFINCNASGNVGDGLTFAQFNQYCGSIGGKFNGNTGWGISINTAGAPDNIGVVVYNPEATNNTAGQLRRLTANASLHYWNTAQALPYNDAGLLGNTWASPPAAAATPGRIVSRDSNGSFAAAAVRTGIVIPTYGATVNIDANLANSFLIKVTNGTAFTIASPTNPVDGQEIRISVRNQSGGAHGAITMGAAYKLVGGATGFPVAANGFSRTVTFVYDTTGGAWYEQQRGAADVPN